MGKGSRALQLLREIHGIYLQINQNLQNSVIIGGNGTKSLKGKVKSY